MISLPELPSTFQNAFETAKVKAELEYATRAEHFPRNPQYADFPFHRPLLIQKVFFAFCSQARSACRAGEWTIKQVSQSTEAAWPIICDYYFAREYGASSQTDRARFRLALWRTVTDDTQWKQHLTELAALAEGAATAAAVAGTGEDPKAAKAADEQEVVGPKRLKSTISSPSAARRMEAYLESKPMNQTDFAGQAQTTDRTLRSFRKTGKVRRDIFENIAKAMGTTAEELAKPT